MITFLQQLCYEAIIDEKSDLHKQISINNIDISPSKNNLLGHFQFNSSMKLSNIIKKQPLEISEIIKKYIQKKITYDELTITITGAGFVNFLFKKKFINKQFQTLINNINYKVKSSERKKIILDYSGPNIAKDMHVGHLRSTIVGDCLSKILMYIGHKVIKISHIGDWGTQFGLLINYLKEKYSTKDIKNLKITLKELSNHYKNAQMQFEININFKKNAHNEVVKLQNEHIESLNIWKKITKTSIKEHKKIYSLLNIKITNKGESFYRHMLNPLIKKLNKNNLIQESNNAKCVYIPGFKNKDGNPLPLIIKKSDGGFNYATTELASLYYRIKYHKADQIIYITDVGQSDHFYMLFQLIKILKLEKKTHTDLKHIPLGLMLNKDGKKIKTRSGKSEKLINLLKKSINITKKTIKNKKRHFSQKAINQKATIIGINTIKYADLSNKLNQNYIFDYEKMLQYSGNTASFLMYAYVRINSIKNKSEKLTPNTFNEQMINIIHESEIDLALHLLQYKYTIQKTVQTLDPNILTNYLYKLSEKFHVFFHKCNVINSEYKYSRLIICDVTKKILKQGLMLLGLKTIKKM